MQIIGDFHLHSKYARATSKNLNLEELSNGQKIKGLNLLATGDFTHPLWLKELKEKLVEDGNGIYSYNGMKFIFTTEIASVSKFNGAVKRVHHNIHAPSIEVVEQINEALSKFGKLSSDGRPIMAIDPVVLVETVMNISKDCFVYPNHAWTPWWAVFGSMSGFNSLKDCYQDQAKNIHAIETGLSSDPAMNWRLSQLDDIALISNSDAHSAHPWRLGREANVFDLKNFDYFELHKAIKEKDPKKFLYTIEVDPSYGKYHFTGHRDCKVVMHPNEAKKLNDICPVCKRKMTVGVLQRIEELADRPEDFVPKNAIPFKSLLPLYEIISFVKGVNQLYSKKVVEVQDKLIAAFGNEMKVLLEVSKEEIVKISGEEVADAVIKIREGKVKYEAGYDGVYGKPIFDGKEFQLTKVDQKTLAQFKK